MSPSDTAHRVTIHRWVRASCCDRHMTTRAECSCGWVDRKPHANGGYSPDPDISSSILSHRLAVIEKRLGHSFAIEHAQERR